MFGQNILLLAAMSLMSFTRAAEFVFDRPISAYDSYQKTALDACALVASFEARNFTDVRDIYENGRFANRTATTFRIARTTLAANYTGEQWYDDALAYGYNASYLAAYMGSAVYGTGPFATDVSARVAAGKSWSRVYQVIYAIHEMDAGISAAKRTPPNWNSTAGEVADGYALYLGQGPCSLRTLFQSVSVASEAKWTDGFVGLSAAAKAQNITGINAYRADVIAALSEIMLNLTATTAANTTAMPTAAKAGAFPFFKTIEPYVGVKAPVQARTMNSLLDSTNTTAVASAQINATVRSIASANSLKL